MFIIQPTNCHFSTCVYLRVEDRPLSSPHVPALFKPASEKKMLWLYSRTCSLYYYSLKKCFFFSGCTAHNNSYLKLQRCRQSILCFDFEACGTTHESLSHIKNLQYYKTFKQRFSVLKDFCTWAPVKKGEWLLFVM